MSIKSSNHPAFGGQGRKAYTEWFMEHFSKDPQRSRLIDKTGKSYYDEVMKIHRERLEMGNFNHGPQSVEEWEALRLQLLRED